MTTLAMTDRLLNWQHISSNISQFVFLKTILRATEDNLRLSMDWAAKKPNTISATTQD